MDGQGHAAGPSRRALMRGVAVLAPLAMAPGAADAAIPARRALQRVVERQKDESVARIQDWIRHPTIAAEGLNIQEGAQYMQRLAAEAGFQNAAIVQTEGSPGVFATWDAGAPKTLGVYFMYDVKQFDPAEWTSPPLEARLVEKAGFGNVIMGRGAVNQKGPEGAFLAALHALRAAGRTPPVNLVLVAEGEEEIGSPNFRQVVERPEVTAALQRAEGVFIPSASQDPATGGVTLVLGAKGIIECELVSSGARWGRGPSHDIHSSNKAMVDSPVWRLVSALRTLVTEDGNTPAIEGLVAGYTGPGGKTILPGRAAAKLDLRLVPNQTRAEAEAKLNAHLRELGFADIEVNVTGGYDPTETSETSRIVRAELAVCRRARVEATLSPRSAGSWPGCVFTGAPLSLPAVQFGLGHGGGAHAPDEYFVIDSTNPRVMGLAGATMAYLDFMYEMAM